MTIKLRLLSLLIVLSCVFAKAQDAPTGAFTGLVSVNTSLKSEISSKNAKADQPVIATLDNPTTIGGTVLPRGSTLIGRIVDVTKHSKDTPNGSITILFDKAKTKKGDPIDIRASIFKIMPSENMRLAGQTDVTAGMRQGTPTNSPSSGVGSQNAVSQQVDNAVLRGNIDSLNNKVSGMQSAAGAPVQVVSGIEGVALSAVASDTKSGIMTSKNHDVELPASMSMVIGVALKQ